MSESKIETRHIYAVEQAMDRANDAFEMCDCGDRLDCRHVNLVMAAVVAAEGAEQRAAGYAEGRLAERAALLGPADGGVYVPPNAPALDAVQAALSALNDCEASEDYQSPVNRAVRALLAVATAPTAESEKAPEPVEPHLCRCGHYHPGTRCHSHHCHCAAYITPAPVDADHEPETGAAGLVRVRKEMAAEFEEPAVTTERAPPPPKVTEAGSDLTKHRENVWEHGMGGKQR